MPVGHHSSLPIPGHRATDHVPLAATIQSVPHPLNSSAFKSISLQFRDKDVVHDHVKGLRQPGRCQQLTWLVGMVGVSWGWPSRPWRSFPTLMILQFYLGSWWGWAGEVWGSWRFSPTLMILWFYLGTRSVDVVRMGWGWTWCSWRSFPTLSIQWFSDCPLPPRQWISALALVTHWNGSKDMMC